MTAIADIWTALERSTREERGWLTRRLNPNALVALYAAVAGQSGQIALLLEVDAEYPAARGFSVRAIPQVGNAVRIELALTAQSYRNIFAVLVDDVVSCVTGCSSESEAAAIFLSRLHIWQEFMRRYSPEGLSLSEQVGLVSELYVLNEFLLDHFSEMQAVSAWTGPLDGLHDFELGRFHIEVKGSAASPPTTFNVSHVAQLEPAEHQSLLLTYLAWSISSEGATTLPALVEGIRSKLSDRDSAARMQFDELLINAGYLDIHESIYRNSAFHKTLQYWFSVTEGFPRIRATDLQAGILDCSYIVDIAACQPFVVSEKQAFEMIAGRQA